MKNRKIRLNVLGVLIMGIALFACSNDSKDGSPLSMEEDEIPVFIDIKNTPLPDKLDCKLYVFSKASSASGYSLDTDYTMTSSQVRVKLTNKDLIESQFRFLFVATYVDDPQVSVLAKDGSSLARGDMWDDLMIRANTSVMADSSYYAVLDKSGSDILATGNIQATLTRLVGQMMFDIYKVGPETNEDQAVNIAPGYYSVLDRVYKIEIAYSGRTKDIVFDTDNHPVHYSVWDEEYVQTIEPQLILKDSIFDMVIDTTRSIPDLTLSVLAQGSASVSGIYCMPSNENMEVRMTFYYYDTTPVCGETHEVHAETCFPKTSIVLNLPKQSPDRR